MASTYHLKDAAHSGSDSNSGLSAILPWLTIAHAQATMGAGDTLIGHDDNGPWREMYTFPASGISLLRSGDGANRPFINGADDISALTWTAETPENFTDASGPKPEGWWELAEASGNRADGNTTNNNTLSTSAGTISRVTGPTSAVPYGAHLTAASSQALQRTDGNLSAAFPGKSSAGSVSLTFGGWFKPSSLTAEVGMMGKGDRNTLNVDASGQVYVQIFDAGYSPHSVYSGPGKTVVGTWTHWAGTWDSVSKAVTLYRNGQSIGTPTTAATILQDYRNFFVGFGVNYLGYFDGDVAEPFCFASLLTQAQIQSIVLSGLAGVGGATWYTAAESGKHYSRAIIVNGTKCALCANKGDIGSGTYKSWYDSVNLRHYITTDGVVDPNSATVEATSQARTHCLYASTRNTLTITGWECRYGHDSNIAVSGGTGTLDIGFNKSIGSGGDPGTGNDGILVYGIGYGASPVAATGVHIHDNESNGNLNNAIEVWCLDGALIENNFGGGNGGCIELWGYITNSTIQGNYYSSAPGNTISTAGVNPGRGLWGTDPTVESPMTGNHSGNIVARNRFLSCASVAVQIAGGTGWGVYHNSWKGCGVGLWVESAGVTLAAKNNVGMDSTTYEVYIDATVDQTLAIDYNDWYRTAGGTPFWWKGTGYNFADWKTNSGLDAHSLNADPLFVDAAGGNFTRTFDSPCRDKGVVIAGINDGTGGSTHYLGSAPDIGYDEYVPVLATVAVASKTLTYDVGYTPFVPVTASGGASPYTYAVSGGSLPTGVSFNTSTGTVSGTATAGDAVTTFTVTVTDANAETSAGNFDLIVGGVPTGSLHGSKQGKGAADRALQVSDQGTGAADRALQTSKQGTGAWSL